MSIYGWIWFAIFGVACPVALAAIGSAWWLLLMLPLYAVARSVFWSPWGL